MQHICCDFYLVIFLGQSPQNMHEKDALLANADEVRSGGDVTKDKQKPKLFLNVN